MDREESSPSSTPQGITHLFRRVFLPLAFLFDLTMIVDAGEHVGTIGRSRTGRSTLLNILGLLDAPTAGDAEFDGELVEEIARNRAAAISGRDIGFVFQQFNHLPGRTAVENVEAPLMYATGSTRSRTASPEVSSRESRSPAHWCA